ncbi:MAG: hypothetical protein WBA91_10215 [Paracoccaceae bacterium]
MKRQFTAFVTAAALAMATVTAQPVLAKDQTAQDISKVLLGAAIIGLILNESKKNNRSTTTSRARAVDWDDGYSKKRIRARTVPAECLMDVRINNRLREVVSSRCMREFGLSRGLPSVCAFDIRTSVGPRTVYGPKCLRDKGYRIADSRY